MATELQGILGGFQKLFKKLDNLKARNIKRSEEHDRSLDWHVSEMEKHSAAKTALRDENDKIALIQKNVNDLLAGSLQS